MFEIKKEEKVTKTFRMPKSLVEQLGKIAQKEGVSVNSLVVQCCEYALNDFDSKNKKKVNYVAEE